MDKFLNGKKGKSANNEDTDARTTKGSACNRKYGGRTLIFPIYH